MSPKKNQKTLDEQKTNKSWSKKPKPPQLKKEETQKDANDRQINLHYLLSTQSQFKKRLFIHEKINTPLKEGLLYFWNQDTMQNLGIFMKAGWYNIHNHQGSIVLLHDSVNTTEMTTTFILHRLQGQYPNFEYMGDNSMFNYAGDLMLSDNHKEDDKKSIYNISNPIIRMSSLQEEIHTENKSKKPKYDTINIGLILETEKFPYPHEGIYGPVVKNFTNEAMSANFETAVIFFTNLFRWWETAGQTILVRNFGVWLKRLSSTITEEHKPRFLSQVIPQLYSFIYRPPHTVIYQSLKDVLLSVEECKKCAVAIQKHAIKDHYTIDEQKHIIQLFSLCV